MTENFLFFCYIPTAIILTKGRNMLSSQNHYVELAITVKKEQFPDDEKSSIRRGEKLKKIAKTVIYVAGIGFETIKTALTPTLKLPFFTGKPILAGVPHLKGGVLGHHIHFNADLTDRLVAEANKTPLGIVTYWATPFAPALYVKNNQARLAIIKESQIGSICDQSENYLRWMVAGNNVMINFLAFMNVNSQRYREQRRFLLKFFHSGAGKRMLLLDETTKDFLSNYSTKYGTEPRSLRQFIMLLVLHTSSQMLGLTECGLDTLYWQNPVYRDAIEKVVQYGISERGKPELEKILFSLFLKIFEINFDVISALSPENNFIECIFDSFKIRFPHQFGDFHKLSADVQHSIAMTFIAVALAGIVHSTVNSLDWALARLIKNKDKLDELTQLMKEHRDIDLTDEWIFDKQGPLFKLAEWVLHSVFLYPSFAHEFFYSKNSFHFTIPNHDSYKLPNGMLIVVNYFACNRGDTLMVSPETFSNNLAEKSTTARFMRDPRVASFGGSQCDKKSRICPGGKTALLENMIILGELLKMECLQSIDEKTISAEIDRNTHPLCSRVNRGDIVIAPKSEESKLSKQSVTAFSIMKPSENKCQYEVSDESKSLRF